MILWLSNNFRRIETSAFQHLSPALSSLLFFSVVFRSLAFVEILYCKGRTLFLRRFFTLLLLGTMITMMLQALVLPRTTILLLLFLTAFIWIAVSNSDVQLQSNNLSYAHVRKTQFLIFSPIYLEASTTSTILQVILMLLLAVRLRCIIWDLSRSFLLRLAITIFSIILIYTMAQVNVVSAVFLCSNRSYPGILSFSSI